MYRSRPNLMLEEYLLKVVQPMKAQAYNQKITSKYV